MFIFSGDFCRVRLLVLLAILASGLWLIAQNDETFKWPGAEDIFAQARAVAADDPRQSISLFRRGLSLEPNSVAARIELVRLLEAQQNLGAAVAELRRCQELQPAPGTVRELVGLLMKLGDRLGAAIEAEKGAVAFPDSGDLQLLAVERLRAAGNEKKAVTLLERHSQSNPADAQAQVLLGQISEGQGHLLKAWKAYQNALAADARNSLAQDALKRLTLRAMAVGNCLLFPPAEWVRSGDSLWLPQTGQNVRVGLAPAGPPEETARKLVRAAVPQAYLQEGDGSFFAAAVTELIVAGAKEGRKVTRAEAETLLKNGGLPFCKIVTEKIAAPYPGILARLEWVFTLGYNITGFTDAAPESVLVIVPAGQPLSLVTGCGGKRNVNCADALLELAACIVTVPENRGN